jgi:hypothetical protein
MSVTFTLVNVVPEGVELLAAIRAVGDELAALGYGPSGAVTGFAYLAEEDQYHDGALLAASALDLFTPAANVEDSLGFSVTFQHDDTTFDVRLARQPDGTGICFLDSTDRCVYRFFAEGRGAELRAILVACARGVNSPVGIGAMELDWDSWNERSMRDAIAQGPPGYEGNPPPFALLRKDTVEQSLAGTIGRDRFEIHDVQDYVVLQRAGLSDLYASVRR